jgi:hypothetical protein
VTQDVTQHTVGTDIPLCAMCHIVELYGVNPYFGERNYVICFHSPPHNSVVEGVPRYAPNGVNKVETRVTMMTTFAFTCTYPGMARFIRSTTAWV